MIYLDNCSTTQLDPQVLEAMLPHFQDQFGNASSRWHSLGRRAAERVEYARSQLAAFLGCQSNDVIWTSGATESNNLAIQGVARECFAAGRGHIITQATEHPSVLETCDALRREGLMVTVLPVLENGCISLDELKSALKTQTGLVSLMWANNETGVVQPIAEVALICHEHGIIFHTDATQAVGKLAIDLSAVPIDLLSLSAHKIYGPSGIGALIFRRSSKLRRFCGLQHGGGQERGLRSGTLNVPGIVGLGKAAELARLELQNEPGRLVALRNRFEEAILRDVHFCSINGSGAPRVGHVSSLAFEGIDAESVLLALESVAASTGSACHSEKLEVSHVLRAMKLPAERLRGSIRFSFGRFNTISDVDRAYSEVISVALTLKELAMSGCGTE